MSCFVSAHFMHSIMDFERIGDHCVKLAEVATYNHDSKITYTNDAKQEIVLLADAVNEILVTTSTSFVSDNVDKSTRVEPLDELIGEMCEAIKEHHVRRLQAGTCSVQAGISLVEMLTSFERIAAYCSNIALHVIERHTYGTGFDIHGYAKQMHTANPNYKDYFFEYSKKYSVPLKALEDER